MSRVNRLENSRKIAHEISNEIPQRDTMSFAKKKNGSSSRIPSFSRAHALKVGVKTKKKWSALLCAGETATQRLRALYVAVSMCGHNGAKGYARGDGGGYYPCMAAYTCTLVKEAGGDGGEKNTPSYLVHFYPLKQFQHCFKIVLSRVIVLCMRPRSSGLR